MSIYIFFNLIIKQSNLIIILYYNCKLWILPINLNLIQKKSAFEPVQYQQQLTKYIKFVHKVILKE